ncbi:MAG: SRPBCC family protein [Bacteroidota bacterium]
MLFFEIFIKFDWIKPVYTMPKMHVKKSIVIDSPVEAIYSKLNDFNHWHPWSPWLIMEPEAKVDVAEDAKYYSWDGKIVGSGNMKVLEEKENQLITYDLSFLKPWKSRADVKFELEPAGDKTQVSWYMDSSLPWFMFWMKKMMIAFIGMDYQRGLNMLKDYVEDGEVHSKLEFIGLDTYPGCTYVAIKTACSMDEIGTKMSADFDKLWSFMEDKKDIVAGEPFSIYHKWDMVKGKVSYTSGVPVKSVPDNLPDGIISGKIPETKVYKLKHTGANEHLGNAWSTMYNYQRNKVFKKSSKTHPFETYGNAPGEVPDNELITTVHFAAR